MFDELLDDDPYLLERDVLVVRRVAQEAELQILRSTVVRIIQQRFPDLVEFAQQKVAQITNTEKLQLLTDQIVNAPDENFTRTLLDISAAS